MWLQCGCIVQALDLLLRGLRLTACHVPARDCLSKQDNLVQVERWQCRLVGKMTAGLAESCGNLAACCELGLALAPVLISTTFTFV